MTFVRVVEECGRWRLRTLMGNVVGPRLWGAEPPNGLPPITDIFMTKDEAVQAAELWNAYHLWTLERSGKASRKRKCTKTH